MIIENLKKHPIYVFCEKLIAYCIEKEVSRHAKALSFSTILSMVPLISIFLGIFAGSHWMSLAEEKLQDLLISNLIPGQIRVVFVSYLNTMVVNASQIKIVGIAFFFFSIFFLFVDIQDSFTQVTQSNCQLKWYSRYISASSLFVAPFVFFLFFGLVESMLSVSPVFLQNIIKTMLEHSFWLKLMLIFFLWMWFSFLYYFIPQRKMHIKYVLSGAGITTISFVISQQLFSVYLSKFSSYSIIYGIFSIIPIFILWIYLNWQIVLYGLVITFFCEINYKKDHS